MQPTTLAAGGCSILREDRDVQFGREEGEELPDVVGIQFTGMSLAVVHDEAPDPVDVGFLSQDTESAPDSRGERRAPASSCGFMIPNRRPREAKHNPDAGG